MENAFLCKFMRFYDCSCVQYIAPMLLTPSRLSLNSLFLPALGPIQAGFPSPAEDYTENTLDLSRLLIRRQAATFVLRARGGSMDPTVNDGDLLVVDRSITPLHGEIVIAEVDGGFTVKRLYHQGDFVSLLADNPDFSPTPLEPGNTLAIWGVVTHIIHTVCSR